MVDRATASKSEITSMEHFTGHGTLELSVYKKKKLNNAELHLLAN
jgi:hypothetical protein